MNAKTKTMKRALALLLAAGAGILAAEARSLAYDTIKSDGRWPYHCQGVATDGKSVCRSFTTVLVKSDLTGRTLDTFRIDSGHMGDLCFHEGRLFLELDGSVWVVQPLTFRNPVGTETCSANLYRSNER